MSTYDITTATLPIDDVAIGPTPVLALQIPQPPGYHDRLAEIVLAREDALIDESRPTPIAGLSEGMTTHWQAYNVLNWPEPECRRLRAAVLRAISEFLARHCPADEDGHQILGISCWANVLRAGERLSEHTHAPAYLLGNYLVQAPAGSGTDGATRYRSPEDPDAAELVVPPRPGQLVVCRGNVPHSVDPHTDSAERISIAFDCIVKKQNPLVYLGDERALEPFESPRWYRPE